MLKQLLAISEYPNLSILPHQEFYERLGTLIKTYGLIFIVIVFVGPFIITTDHFVTHVLHYKTIFPVQKDTMSRFIHKLGYRNAAIYICLVGPMLEEIIFRLPLSLKKKHISAAITIAVFLFSGVFLHHITNLTINIAVRLLISAVVYLTCMLAVPNGLSIIDHRFSKQLIILSICLFGLMHISNYVPIQWPLIWLYPIYVLPQLAMGWAITFLRFKNGFFWGFALHCVINSVSMLLAYGHLSKAIYQGLFPVSGLLSTL